MLAMGEEPALPMVRVCGALATPGCVLVKVRLEGVTLKTGGAIPVPLSDTVWVRMRQQMVSVPRARPSCAGRKPR